jgi:hypothetical protein
MGTYNLVDTGICAGDEYKESYDKHNKIADCPLDVLLVVPLALLQEEEPHDRRNPERKSRNE